MSDAGFIEYVSAVPFIAITCVTPDSTLYVMVAVLPEYEMLPDIVGAVYCTSNDCWTDAGLSRPLRLPTATTTMFTLSVNVTLIVAVVPDTDVVLRTLLSDTFLTCT